MSDPLVAAPVAAHATALLVLPLLVVAYVRERARHALAQGADSAAVYFASAQWLAHLPAAVLVALVASIGSPLALWALHGTTALSRNFAPLLLLPFLLLPIASCTFAAAWVMHEITRETRGSDLTLGEDLTQAAWGVTLLAIPLVGLLGWKTAVGMGSAPLGLLVAVAAFFAMLAARERWAKRAGLEPHAISHGDLRERVFALAGRSGVKLQQLYVVPMRRSRTANAFAVTGDSVILTDWLLEHLGAREIDAVLAHELAHIRLGHPRKLALAAGIGGALGMLPVFLWNQPAAIAVSVVLSIAAGRLVSRRFEFEADALALKFTGDPEALATALARISRLNHLPLEWSRSAEQGLTHPSTLRRIEAIARAAGVDDVVRAGWLAARATPTDLLAVPVPAHATGKVFSSARKRALARDISWWLLAGALAAAAGAITLAQSCALPRQALLASGAGASLAMLVLLGDLLATRGIAGLRQELGARLGAGASAHFVGLAPGAEPRVYEGFFDWDLGFVLLVPGALVYRGEETSFTLPRETITGIRSVAGPPGWILAPRVAIEWRDPERGTSDVLEIRPAHSARMDALAADHAALLSAIERWRDAPALANAPPFAPPPEAVAVTGTALAALTRPATLLVLFVPVAVGSLLAAWMFGLQGRPFGAPGPLDVFVAVMSAFVLQRIPMWKR